MSLVAQIAKALTAFLTSREGARRFHAADIGDVDPYHCFGDFVTCIKARNHNRLEGVYKTALAETSGATGGWLVPTELRLDLMRTIEEAAIVRPRALVVPMASLQLRLPIPDATTAQAANVAPYFGGIDLTWVAEGDAFPETEPLFRSVDLNAWVLGGFAVASNTLLADSLAADEWLRVLFGRAVAWYEDQAFLVGSGVGQPVGFLNSGAVIPVTRNAPNHFKFVDAATMVANLLPSSWTRAVWVMHPSALADLVSIEETTAAGWQVNQPREPGVSGPVGVLHSMPVYVSDKLPALGTEGDVMLVDCGLYVIGDRQMITIDVGDQVPTYFQQYQSLFRVAHRVDGQPWLSQKVTLADGTKTASGYVVLN